MMVDLESVYPMDEEDVKGVFCECVEWRKRKKRFLCGQEGGREKGSIMGDERRAAAGLRHTERLEQPLNRFKASSVLPRGKRHLKGKRTQVTSAPYKKSPSFRVSVIKPAPIVLLGAGNHAEWSFSALSSVMGLHIVL